MLLKVRDQMLAAVDLHRQRRRRADSGTSGKSLSGRTMSRDSANGRKGSLPKELELEIAMGSGAAGGGSPPKAAAAAVEDPVADAKLAAASSAAAAAANAAAGLGPDGKPFHLTSDWLSTGLSLYRISEDRAESIRHMSSSSGLDPSVRSRPPPGTIPEGTGDEQDAPKTKQPTATQGASPAPGAVGAVPPRKSRLGNPAHAAFASADGADAGDECIDPGDDLSCGSPDPEGEAVHRSGGGCSDHEARASGSRPSTQAGSPTHGSPWRAGAGLPTHTTEAQACTAASQKHMTPAQALAAAAAEAEAEAPIPGLVNIRKDVCCERDVSTDVGGSPRDGSSKAGRASAQQVDEDCSSRESSGRDTRPAGDRLAALTALAAAGS
ncbi:hypothetical protein GPECTOR_78g60 [Gonium pectorale]|uniref:Uncharacterized protein n=1 Tax=Gonium pectorale TaxID=33097 RepID=A0A150G1X5_GONPE|nr:hypothetical protein GPECTOR_78g60 [Gonium pectorale]|eukprot:KXZ43872.1 hypothetical protein GPECTOR_78g60 [Gonium pectorale]